MTGRTTHVRFLAPVATRTQGHVTDGRHPLRETNSAPTALLASCSATVTPIMPERASGVGLGQLVMTTLIAPVVAAFWNVS